MNFVYDALPMRVVFGPGRIADLRAEIARLELERVVVLSTPGGRPLADRAAGLLGDSVVGIFDKARMHVPVDVADAARDWVVSERADGCVAIGGGSTIGLGKAVALTTGLPVVAVPTTYAGSEMTPIWGLTDAAGKKTGRDRKVLPRSVVYDPELTVGLPPATSATSGLNAVAHAMEALYAPDRSPITSLMAEEGVRSLASALDAVLADGGDITARVAALRGAWLCGACLGATTMGLHHKLCHVLGGTFDLPHAATHAVVLPYVAALTLPNEPDANAALARALQTADPARGLADLVARLGAPSSLGELGLREEDVDVVVNRTLANSYDDRRASTPEQLRSVLLAALRGDSVAQLG